MNKTQLRKTKQCWHDMKQRCLNEKCKAFHRYGGRGITICDSWVLSFDNFLADMGLKPNGMSIDRIDNENGYFKENCRWATPTQQIRNTKFQYKNDVGVVFEGGAFTAYITVKRKTYRLGTFKTKEQAIEARKDAEIKYWDNECDLPIFNGLQRNNTLGYKGIAFDKRSSKWYAYIDINKSRKHLGTFLTKDEAVTARKQYEAFLAHGIGDSNE